MAQWPFSPSSAFLLPKYAYYRSLYDSKGGSPFVPAYEKGWHLQAGAQFGATGLGNLYALLDECNDPTIGSYNHYHLSPNGIPRGNQRWYGLVYLIQIAGEPRIRPRK